MHVLIKEVAWEIKLLAKAISLKYKYNLSFICAFSITGTVI